MRQKGLLAVVVALICIIVTTGCTSSEEAAYAGIYGPRIKLGATLHEIREDHKNVEDVGCNNTKSYLIEDGIRQYVIFGADAKVEKSFDFIPGEGIQNILGFTPIHFEGSFEQYLGMESEDLEAQLGEQHFSASCRSYTPGYISDTGYFVSFSISADKDKVWLIEIRSIADPAKKVVYNGSNSDNYVIELR